MTLWLDKALAESLGLKRPWLLTSGPMGVRICLELRLMNVKPLGIESKSDACGFVCQKAWNTLQLSEDKTSGGSGPTLHIRNLLVEGNVEGAEISTQNPLLLKSSRIQNLARKLLAGYPLVPNTSIPFDWFNKKEHLKVESVVRRGGEDGVSGDVAAFSNLHTRLTFLRHRSAGLTETDRKKWARQVSEVVPGYDDIVRILTTTIAQSLSLQAKNMHILLPHLFMIHGQPGVGKTSLARNIASFSGLESLELSIPDIFTAKVGPKEWLMNFFSDAASRSPCIIIMDDIDAISGGAQHDAESIVSSILGLLLEIFDALNCPGLRGIVSENRNASLFRRRDARGVFVIATTSRIHAVHPQLLRSGRFDSFQMHVPNAEKRLEILKVLCGKFSFEQNTEGTEIKKEQTKNSHSIILPEIAGLTHGFVAADLHRLCMEGLIRANRRRGASLKDRKLESDDDTVSRKVIMSPNDFHEVLATLRPSRLARFEFKTDQVEENVLSRLGGIDDIIAKLKLLVLEPIQRPEQFRDIGVQPPKGILIYGPPGVGKTDLAVGIAKASGMNVLHINGTQVISKVVGESAKTVQEVFRLARESSPSIVLIDQIEVLAVRRSHDHDSSSSGFDRLLSTMLIEMDGINSRTDFSSDFSDTVIVIATTAHRDQLDPAMTRPGRLDQQIYIPPPSASQRLQILKKCTEKIPLEGPCDWKQIALQTQGFSGADIANLCREAVMISLRENIDAKTVGMRQFESALKFCLPSLSTSSYPAEED
eukprot:CAMPEP_0197533940 /NCGR_PEP_ID=MMETSP1318-20131121/45327_1 /TAXON_ID=552666 /ORGANISM="Partenskyella glossopodia, Strain RCC365" /LENGTH=762 /DNA_ID=CAMNT_0043091013 /DNA_START=28 /DNA_END=2316 /DNA_ORIENTATION=-